MFLLFLFFCFFSLSLSSICVHLTFGTSKPFMYSNHTRWSFKGFLRSTSNYRSYIWYRGMFTIFFVFYCLILLRKVRQKNWRPSPRRFRVSFHGNERLNMHYLCYYIFYYHYYYLNCRLKPSSVITTIHHPLPFWMHSASNHFEFCEFSIPPKGILRPTMNENKKKTTTKAQIRVSEYNGMRI